jgi:hypothetical protein
MHIEHPQMFKPSVLAYAQHNAYNDGQTQCMYRCTDIDSNMKTHVCSVVTNFKQMFDYICCGLCLLVDQAMPLSCGAGLALLGARFGG